MWCEAGSVDVASGVVVAAVVGVAKMASHGVDCGLWNDQPSLYPTLAGDTTISASCVEFH